jgi:hypothetical protein
MVRPAWSATLIPRCALTARGLNSGRRATLRHAAHVAIFIEVLHVVTSASSKILRLPWDQQAASAISPRSLTVVVESALADATASVQN